LQCKFWRLPTKLTKLGYKLLHSESARERTRDRDRDRDRETETETEREREIIATSILAMMTTPVGIYIAMTLLSPLCSLLSGGANSTTHSKWRLTFVLLFLDVLLRPPSFLMFYSALAEFDVDLVSGERETGD